MVVILVILILAAILIPQFGLAQERARKAQCVSNQRNIESAVSMWNTDNQSALFTGNTMDTSTPSYTNLTSVTQYTPVASFKEPDTFYAGNPTGAEYYLSMGNPTGGSPSVQAQSYGHVACAADKVPDPWVANYDGTAGAVNNINHTRGSQASP